jgi:NAD(P)-dependent dehydrogenase (short-subunit alcohol dehydrogenase family)
VTVEGKVAVVTGATSGLGRALAEELAARGARVIGVGRRPEPGAALEAAVRNAGGTCDFVRADISVVGDCDRIVTETLDRHGRLDLFVNNAATVGTPPLVDTTEATEAWWDDVMDTNLKGAFFCCRAALVPMKEQRSGLILNVASTNAVVPLARMQAYNASKAALVHLSKGLAVEHQHFGLRVNAIVLGAVAGETGLATAKSIQEHLTGSEVPDEQLTILRRIGQSARSVARAIATLASDDLRNVTGAEIALDRGITAGLLAGSAFYLTLSGEWQMPLEGP